MIETATTMRINDREIPALEHQRRFLNIRTRNPLLVGGFGCGKSHILLRKVLQGCAENPGLPFIYACLTYPLLRDAIVPEMFEVLRLYDLIDGWDYTFNHTSTTLTLHIFSDADGVPATILFRPVETKAALGRMRGITAAGAGLDELAYMPKEAYRAVSERVRHRRAKNPFVAGATTPEGFNFVHDLWVTEPRARAASAGVQGEWVEDEQFRFVRGRTMDNPNLDPGYVDALKSQYDERLVNAYLNGHFVPMFTGRCFRFDEATHVSRKAVYDRNLPICMGWDFNVNPMSVTLSHWHKGQMWTFGEIVLEGSHTEDVCAEFLHRFGKGGLDHTAGVRIFGDASGKARTTKSRFTDYDLIQEHIGREMPGFDDRMVPRQNPGQRESINTFNALLKNGHGHVSYAINPGCVHTIKSLLTTVYDDNGSIAKGDDNYEHLTDGLRYFAWQVAPINKTRGLGRKLKRGERA